MRNLDTPTRRVRTLDRGPPSSARTPLYTVGQIGPKRKLRHDGSLLCEEVPIARTGIQMYRPGEVPLRAPTRLGAAQVIYVTRDRATLFAPESLGSVIGAAITLDHPPVDVTPTNWQQLACGFVLDAWQGETEDTADLMFADLVITDKGLIHKVNTEGLREVSLGYDAHYEQTGDGEGRQRNIVVNHLALVERGRCGPRCAIGDRQPEEITMAQGNGTGGPRPRVRLQEATAAIRSALDSLEPGGDEDDEDGVHVHVHMGGDPPAGTRTKDKATVDDPPVRTLDADTEERISSIEEGMLEMHDMLRTIQTAVGVKTATTDSDPAAAAAAAAAVAAAGGDSTALQTGFQQFVAQAEILVPGYKVPTFDSALPRAKTVDAMCAGRRQVLTLLGATTDGATLLKNVAEDDFDIVNSPCGVIATVFKSAAAVKASANNRATTGDRMGVPHFIPGQSVVPVGGMKPMNADEINAANAKYWSQQK